MAEAKAAETWQYNRTVLERNRYMLENQLATDVTFLVGENQARRIPAHQYVLISGSPVFYSMFCGDMRETGEVRVPDISPDTFTQMLRYLYYEEADITGDSVMQILYCSKKYLVPGLSKKCTDFLKDNLSGENAAAILEQCLLFDEQEMVSKCMKVIGEETEVVLNSKSFVKVSIDTLESDSTSVSEVELFNGCVDWVRRKTSGKKPSGDVIRNTLEKALFKLRFPVMTIEEFCDIVVPTEILNNEEEILCHRYFSQKKKPTNMPFPTTPRSNTVPRGYTVPRSNNSCPLIHLTHDQNLSLITKQVSYLQFTIENKSAKDLSIKGFVTYGRLSGLYYKTYINGRFTSDWTSLTNAYSAGICKHDTGKTYITFPFFTIPEGNTYKIQMKSSTYPSRCISTDNGITFSNPSHTISVLVKGDIPISEIVIA